MSTPDTQWDSEPSSRPPVTPSETAAIILLQHYTRQELSDISADLMKRYPAMRIWTFTSVAKLLESADFFALCQPYITPPTGSVLRLITQVLNETRLNE